MNRVINASIVLAAGTFGITKLLTIDYDSWHHNDSYSETKAGGEALVIKANGVNGLLTCCIRPSSIFGPGDKLLVPSLVAAARAGKSNSEQKKDKDKKEEDK